MHMRTLEAPSRTQTPRWWELPPTACKCSLHGVLFRRRDDLCPRDGHPRRTPSPHLGRSRSSLMHSAPRTSRHTPACSQDSWRCEWAVANPSPWSTKAITGNDAWKTEYRVRPMRDGEALLLRCDTISQQMIAEMRGADVIVFFELITSVMTVILCGCIFFELIKTVVVKNSLSGLFFWNYRFQYFFVVRWIARSVVPFAQISAFVCARVHMLGLRVWGDDLIVVLFEFLDNDTKLARSCTDWLYVQHWYSLCQSLQCAWRSGRWWEKAGIVTSTFITHRHILFLLFNG